MDFIFSERDIMTDAVQSEKIMLLKCSQLLGESSCQELRHLIIGIMTETQELQFELYNAMKNHGWVSRDVATSDKIKRIVEETNLLKERI